jgi:hypothetical protein
LLKVAVEPLSEDYLNVFSGHKIIVHLWNQKLNTTLGFNMQVFNQQEICIYTVGKRIVNKESKRGTYIIHTEINDRVLNQGVYKCKIWIGELGTVLHMFEDILTFEVVGKTVDGINPDKLPGVTMPAAKIDMYYYI